MLKKVLALLGGGKTWTSQGLARELNLDEEALASRLAYLEHAGYIRRINTRNTNSCSNGGSCGSKAAGCRGCSGATGSGSILVWWEVNSRE